MNIIEHPRLYRLLAGFMESEQQEKSVIEQEIWQMFGENKAILVTDMSHFSRVTKSHGIVHYLSMIKVMQDVVSMALPKHNGNLIKFLADNAFVLFDCVDDAVNCIMEINRKMKEENTKNRLISDVEICSGIDYGKILNINNSDLFGDAVNIASKLGEDTAEAWDVLISDRALNLMSHNQYKSVQHDIEMSGVSIEAHKLLEE